MLGPCTCHECVKHRVTHGTRTYDENGYDPDGYDHDARDIDGRDVDGYDKDGINALGYDRDGNPRNVGSEELDLAELWDAFSGTPDDFLKHLRGITRDADTIDEITFCDHCLNPNWNDEMSSTGNDLRVCDDPCWDDFTCCADCDERFPAADLNDVAGESTVCDRCLNDDYTWCESCEEYYPDDSEHNHDDDDEACCDPPQTSFTVRNDGCEPLANDTRTMITLPAGTISAEGIKAIQNYLREQGIFVYRDEMAALGNQWQTKTGNYAKRLSRFHYQTHRVGFSPVVMSQVGCIARDHSKQVDVEIEVTRDLNQSASAFYHDDSCWWGSYSESRCALKTNGGYGIRAFGERGNVSGRAWVMPLRKKDNGQLTPTFNTMTPDALIVFNGYGELSGYAAARIISHMAGLTYRKISFVCHPMYVNSGGYLVASEEITGRVERYADNRLELDVPQHSTLFRDEQTEAADAT
jgi:hypothetical protein